MAVPGSVGDRKGYVKEAIPGGGGGGSYSTYIYRLGIAVAMLYMHGYISKYLPLRPLVQTNMTK